MITLVAFLAALMALVLAAWFLATVLLIAMEAAENTQKENYLDLFKLFWLQLFNATIVLALSVVLAFVAFFQHLANFWVLYLLLAGIAIPAELNAAFSDEIWEAKDAGFTRFWVPVYHNFVIPLLRVVEVLWRLAVCLYNFLGSVSRVIFGNAFTLAFECDGMRWGNVADGIAELIENVFSGLFFWIISFFSDDFQLTPILASVAKIVAEFEPLGACWCKTTNFVVEWVVRVLGAKNLHNTLDRALNTFLSFWVEAVQFAVGLFDLIFGVGPIVADPNQNQNQNQATCDEGGDEGDYGPNGTCPLSSSFGVTASEDEEEPFIVKAFGENPDRAPRWQRTSEDACLTLQHLSVFVDDILGISLDIFFGINPANVPKVGHFLGNFMCAFISPIPPFLGVDVFRILFDTLFHFDVLFAGNWWGALQDDLDPFFAHAYNTSRGIEEFWRPIGHPITDDIGCIFSALANTTIAAFEVTIRVVLGIPDNLNFEDLKDFIESPRIQDPSEFLLDQALLAVDCTASLMTNINEPLGTAFNETVHVIVAASKLIVRIVLNIKTLLAHFKGDEYDDDSKALFDELFGLAVSYADFIRQFAVTPPDFQGFGKCWTRGPHAFNRTAVLPVNGTASLDNVDVFCCVGKIVEGLMRAYFWFWEFAVRGIHAIFGAASFKDAWLRLFADADGPGKVSRLIAPLELVLEGIACIFPAIIDLIEEVLKGLGATGTLAEFLDCTGDTVAVRLFDFLSKLLKLVILTVPRILDIGLEMIGHMMGFEEAELTFAFNGGAKRGSCPVDFRSPAINQGTPFVVGEGALWFGSADCMCWALLRFYGQTMGRLVDTVASFLRLAACMFSGDAVSGIKDFLENVANLLERFFAAPFTESGDLWVAPSFIQDFFGDPSPSQPPSGQRFTNKDDANDVNHPQSIFWKLCTFVQKIFDAIELIVLLFTDFSEFVLRILAKLSEVPVIAGILDIIEDIKDIIQDIKGIFVKIQNYFGQLISSIVTGVACIINFVKDLFKSGFSRLRTCVVSCVFPGRGNSRCWRCPVFSCGFSLPAPPDLRLKRRDGDEGEDLIVVNKTAELFWDPSLAEAACRQQTLEAEEETNPRLKRLLERDAEWCYFSGMVTKMMDVTLYQYSTDVDRRLVDPYVFYDWFTGVEFFANASVSLVYIGDYLLDYTLNETAPTDFNVTVIDYLRQNDVDWIVADRLGVKLDVMARAFKTLNDEGIDTPGGEFMELILDFWRYGWDAWRLPWGDLTSGGFLNGTSNETSDPPTGKKSKDRELVDVLADPRTWVRVVSTAKRRVVDQTKPFFSNGIKVANEIYADWLSRSVYRKRPPILPGLRAMKNAVSARFWWGIEGGAPEDEPAPRGTPNEVKRWSRMVERERDAASPEEAYYWKSLRASMYPNLEYKKGGYAAELREIRSSRERTREQIVTTDCADRHSWDDAGNDIGTCSQKGAFCKVDLFEQIEGACCKESVICAPIEKVGCDLIIDATFKLGFDCESCDVVVNETQGACCLGGVALPTSTGPPPKTCRILDSSACSALGGVWNANKTCAAPDLDPECNHCSLKRVPDVDIGLEILCPAAGDVTFAPCEKRKCWDLIGAEFGPCGVGFDPIFFNPTCDCGVFANFTGNCCVPVLATNLSTCETNFTANECFDAGGTPTFLCTSCSAGASASFGACCHGASGSKRCELTNKGDCAALTGIWNPKKKCNSDELDADCEHCAAQGCRECALLVAVLNQLLDLLVDCFNDLLAIRESVSVSFFFSSSSTPEEEDERTFRQPYDPPREFKIRRRSVVGDGVVSIGRMVLSFFQGIFNSVVWFVEWVFGLEETFRLESLELVDTLQDFFTNDDPDDPDGLLFYVFFIFRCDVEEHTRCEKGRPGLGIVAAIIWFFGTVLVLYFVFTRFFPLGNALLALALAFSLGFVASIAFHISPACFMPQVFPYPWGPLVPNCAGTRVFDLLESLDVPCLPFCEIAGDQSVPSDPNCDQTICPGKAENFRRDWPDCWNDPYVFRGSLRWLFFFFRTRLGPLFCGLSETGLLSFVPFVDERALFPGDPCFPEEFSDARWRWCFRNNILMLFPLIAFFSFWAFFFFSFWATVQLAFVVVIQIPTTVVLFFLAIFNRRSRGGERKESNWRYLSQVGMKKKKTTKGPVETSQARASMSGSGVAERALERVGKFTKQASAGLRFVGTSRAKKIA